MMAQVSQARIRKFLLKCQNGATATDRGRALEDLICYLFGRVPGITVTARDVVNAFGTQEIDVAFWNEKKRQGFYFPPDIILVECKNWATPVGSTEVSYFNQRLSDRGLLFGILVVTNGITGNARDRTDAHSIIAGALRDQRRIITVTQAEIESITDSKELVKMVKTKLCELAVSGTIFL